MKARAWLEKFLENPLVYRWHARMVDRAKEKAILNIRSDYRGLRVLDIGCGPGNNARLFSGADYTGMDINPRYVARAAAAYPQARFLAGDATKTRLGGPFDVILMNSFLHHLDDREVKEVMGTVVGNLVPAGLAIVQEPLIPGPRQYYHRILMRLDRGNHFRTLTEWESLARQGGLAVVGRSFYSLRVFGLRGYNMLSLALAPSPSS